MWLNTIVLQRVLKWFLECVFYIIQQNLFRLSYIGYVDFTVPETSVTLVTNLRIFKIVPLITVCEYGI